VLDGGISSLSAQQVVNFCYAGLTQYCGAFNFAPPAGTTAYVNAQVFNLASIKTSGFDIEASYRFDLPSVPGHFDLRALATNTHKFVTNQGFPGGSVVDTAGQNSGSTPDWKVLAVQTWSSDRFMPQPAGTLVQRRRHRRPVHRVRRRQLSGGQNRSR
jgi:iron complex outermembrane receptor protein